MAGGMRASTGKAFTAGVLCVVALILVFQNTEVVTAHVLFWEFRLSLALLALFTAVLAAIAGFLLGRLRTGRGGPEDRGPEDPART